jgi:predicted ATPase
VETAYVRARALCQQVGETLQLFPVLRGLWLLYLNRAEIQTAHELGKQLLRLAQSVHDPALFLEAYHALGTTLYFLGEFAPAREHLERGLTFYDSQQHGSLAFLYGYDPGVGCLSRVARVLWPLGYPEQALRRSQEALTLAQELSYLPSLGFALGFAGILHQYRREGQVAQERAEAMMALGTEQGFAFQLAFGTLQRGWALAEQGRREEGIVQMRQGLAATRATGANIAGSTYLILLAEAYGKVGQAEEGLALLAEALTRVDKTGQRNFVAELYRLKGELTLQKLSVPSPQQLIPSTQEAEACFLKAIDIARQQQANSWELRATMSLTRLWHQQGKHDEARQMLAEIYGWFTEGFDTKDLQEAKALLEGVSRTLD